MRFMGKALMMIPVLVFATACDRQEVPRPDAVDPLAYLDTVSFSAAAVASPLEAGIEAEEAAAEETKAAPARTSTPKARSTSTRRASSGTYSRPAPAPQTEVVRHTARDAAIGAAGGAVIGAVAGGSRHRVKGAIIGGTAGAVIGGVIGHTVDKEVRVKQY